VTYEPPGRLSVGFVSTFPPTRCGIATFTESLSQAIAAAGALGDVRVVSCVDQPGMLRHPPAVVSELVRGSVSSLEEAAESLNGVDAIILQHEFGLFGGEEGSHVVDLAEELTVPTIAVLHTVLARPSALQQWIVEQLAEVAELVVVQSRAARERLFAAHRVDAERVHVIPHGARPNLRPGQRQGSRQRRPLILTWGLIGPGKGIEFVIDALPLLRDLDPPPRYVVLGQTHPRVRAAEGESYRHALIESARALEVDDLVEFDNSYRTTDSVLAQIRAADVVVLPYRSRDQVVSGVLVEAIASGKPVVATPFPHAVELVGEGSGILVPHGDRDALAEALRSLLTEPELAERAAAVARRQARAHDWIGVGRAYRRLVAAVVNSRVEMAS
jgi:glycosyltransferase involved in cell wall biosynthesis